uniref:BAR domain-containing protein n=1 Tax=Malurus cyaneus samueli TaxID=2593467 RepID=A0A8C5X4S8_9PASS
LSSTTSDPEFHPSSQSPKVGGAEGTKLDDDFKEMGNKAVTEVLTRTIRPSRAKLNHRSTPMSKIRGQVKKSRLPPVRGAAGESMIRYGKELGEDSNFGDALLDAGESMKRLAEVKDSLDIEVKQNFIDPLQNLCDKDLKEIQHHLKKLEGRRLDFDYKKKRQGKIPDEELRQAMEKFEESKEVAETSMHNLLETDIEQVSQLSALVDAQLDYHRQAVQILDELAEKLKRREASSRPKREYKPKPRETYDFGDTDQSNGGFSCNPTPKVSGNAVPSGDGAWTGHSWLWRTPGMLLNGADISWIPELLLCRLWGCSTRVLHCHCQQKLKLKLLSLPPFSSTLAPGCG